MIGVGILLTALVVLVVALARRRGAWRHAPSVRRRLTVTQHGVVLLVLAIANWELCSALTQAPLSLGDLRSHAMVARALATGQARAGWVDVYGGGFPLGPHYPSVAWLVSASMIRIGVAPAQAVTWLGIASVLLAHWLVFRLAWRAGATYGAALLGAAVVSWMTFSSSFFGGRDAILVMGLLTQCFAVPLCLGLGSAVLHGARRPWLIALSALSIASHPQLVISEMALLLVLALGMDRAARRRWGLALSTQVITGAGVFGRGLLTMKIPFGWPPPAEMWRVEGKTPSALEDALTTGEIFDFARTPVVTTVVACCALVLAVNLAARRARLALVGFAFAFGLACIGHPLADAGRLGVTLLSVFQPMRAVLLLPFAGAAIVVVAATEAEAWLARAGRFRGLVVPSLVMLLVAAVALPAQISEAASRRERLASPPCGSTGPSGYDPARVDAALSSTTNGKLYYADSEFADCAASTDLDSSVAVPIAYPFAAGAHVGVTFYALQHASIATVGGDARAELLGVRYALVRVPDDRPPPSGWRAISTVGDTQLWRRVHGDDVFGAACVRSVLRGSDRAMRVAVFEALDHPDSWIWDTAGLTVLEPGQGAAELRPAPSDCDASTTRLSGEHHDASGLFEVDVESAADFDLVLRETAYRTWQFSIDDTATDHRVVAPGFMTIRVPKGRHHVVAAVKIDVLYCMGLAAALFALILLARRRQWLSFSSASVA